MVTWVLYLCIGIVIGGMAGFYFAKLDDFSKRQKQELEAKLRQSEQELIDYKDQVTTHFKETAALINDMTESYQKVHEHLAHGSVNLCNNAVEVNKLTVSASQLMTDSSGKLPTTGTGPGDAIPSEKVKTDQAESEAPKAVTSLDNKADNNNNTGSTESDVDVNISAANAAVEKAVNQDVAMEKAASESAEAIAMNSSDTVAAPPDLSNHPKEPASPEKALPSEQSTGSEQFTHAKQFTEDSTPKEDQEVNAVITPPTETMAVAEELDENAESTESGKVTLPGSQTVH